MEMLTIYEVTLANEKGETASYQTAQMGIIPAIERATEMSLYDPHCPEGYLEIVSAKKVRQTPNLKYAVQVIGYTETEREEYIADFSVYGTWDKAMEAKRKAQDTWNGFDGRIQVLPYEIEC